MKRHGVVGGGGKGCPSSSGSGAVLVRGLTRAQEDGTVRAMTGSNSILEKVAAWEGYGRMAASRCHRQCVAVAGWPAVV